MRRIAMEGGVDTALTTQELRGRVLFPMLKGFPIHVARIEDYVAMSDGRVALALLELDVGVEWGGGWRVTLIR